MFSTLCLYPSLLFSHFVRLFLPFFAYPSHHETQFIMFDLISLQPARNFREIKKYFRVNDQNKCSNTIILGTKYEFFLPLYELTFFLAFGQGKRFFSYHILMNILFNFT